MGQACLTNDERAKLLKAARDTVKHAYAPITRRGKDVRIRAIAVVSESGADCPPCGACRQVIAEFGPDAIIIFQTRSGMEEMHISELLPKGFIAKRKMNK
jgi:cytidine deaminase